MGDWVEYTDHQSGRQYYCHRKTGATQWEKPSDSQEGLEEPSSPIIKSGEAKPSEELREPSEELREPSLSKQESTLNTQTNGFPSKSKESESNKRLGIVVSNPDADFSSNNPSLHAPASVPPVSPPILPRMSSWIAFYDQSSQKYYYQHKTDGSVTWDKPADIETNLIRQTPPLPQNSPPSRAAPSPIPRPSPGSGHGHSRSYSAVSFPTDPKNESGQVPLAAGWAEYFDPSRGKTYYFHEKTNRTTWNRGEAVVPLRVKASETSVPLPAQSSVPQNGISTTASVEAEVERTQLYASLSAQKDETSTRGFGHRPSKSVDVRPGKLSHQTISSPVINSQAPQTNTPTSASGSNPSTQTPGSVTSDRRFSDIFTTSPFAVSKPKHSGRVRGSTVVDSPSESITNKEHRHRTISYFSSLFGSTSHSKPNTSSLFDDINKFQETEFAKRHFANCKRGLFKRKIPMKRFLVWSKDVLDHPLMPNTKGIEKYAQKISKDILMFMGDHKSTRPDYHGQEIISLGRKVAETRDEILLQICKQITENPSRESAMRGWGLLGLCLFSFTPTIDLESHLSTIFDVFEKQKDEIVSRFARYCRARTGRLNNREPRLVTLDEIKTCQDAIFTFNPYNCTIDELLSLQNEVAGPTDSHGVPNFLVDIFDSIRSSGGLKSEGIFRIATDADELETSKTSIVSQRIKIQEIKDPYMLADLMKHFLRDLVVPIVPPKNYDTCAAARNNPEKCKAAFENLPLSHKATLKYILSFIKELAHEANQKYTKMDARSISLVLAPNILRCPSQDPMVVYAKSQDETDFIHTLVLSLP